MPPLKEVPQKSLGGGCGGGWGLCVVGGAHRGPCRASYLARTFLQRPSSFRRSATSCLSTAFSFSRNPARMAIWFSFSRRASRERLAAMLFFLRRTQYLSSCAEMEREASEKLFILTIFCSQFSLGPKFHLKIPFR